MYFAIDEFKFEIFAPMNFISTLLQYLNTLKKCSRIVRINQMNYFYDLTGALVFDTSKDIV